MKILSIGIGFICAASLCGPASAGETYYGAASRALPLQQSAGTARASGMGSAVVAVPQGAASLLWNPAALSRLSCIEMGLHHNSGLGDTTQETAIIGLPVGEIKEECSGDSGSDVKKGCRGAALGGIAASLGYVNYGDFSGRDTLGAASGKYHAGDFSGSGGWGLELLPGVAVGMAMKLNQSRFAGKSYNAFTADMGFLYNVIPGLDLGLAYSNINLGNEIGGQKLASGWRLGAAWAVEKNLLLAVSGELQNEAVDRLQFGGEYLVGNAEDKGKALALRAGYQLSFPDPKLSGLTGLTLGLGYNLSRYLALDYAMAPAGELGTSHRFSLTYKFNCKR